MPSGPMTSNPWSRSDWRAASDILGFSEVRRRGFTTMARPWCAAGPREFAAKAKNSSVGSPGAHPVKNN